MYMIRLSNSNKPFSSAHNSVLFTTVHWWDLVVWCNQCEKKYPVTQTSKPIHSTSKNSFNFQADLSFCSFQILVHSATRDHHAPLVSNKPIRDALRVSEDVIRRQWWTCFPVLCVLSEPHKVVTCQSVNHYTEIFDFPLTYACLPACEIHSLALCSGTWCLWIEMLRLIRLLCEKTF